MPDRHDEISQLTPPLRLRLAGGEEVERGQDAVAYALVDPADDLGDTVWRVTAARPR